MKNVTITLEEEVALWTRVRAAEQDQSVSRFVGEMLRERMKTDRAYEAAMHDYLGRSPGLLKKGGRYPTREELHERPRLR